MLHIAIAKPDFKIRGGFELVLDRVTADLESFGHRVSWLTVDTSVPQHQVYGVDVPDEVRYQATEYFGYLSIVERFSRLDPRDVDLVLCTQPGSWAVPHDRKLAMFNHHLRVFYDLADPFVRGGFVDPDVHAACVREVRAVDGPLLDGVSHFLVPSQEVGARLERFNAVGPDRRSPFVAAGIAPGAPAPPEPDGPVLCVSRHEWPKRTELAVSAGHQLARPGPMVLAGSGGRLSHVQRMDRELCHRDPASIDDEEWWLRVAAYAPPAAERSSERVQILGPVSPVTLDELYRRCLCVVAPALLEDYGLTPIEAMAYGKPAIVCRDGGGLVESVRDGENGLVVEPTGTAIAAAIDRLRDDHELLRHLSEGARATAAGYDWTTATEHLRVGVEAASA